MKLILLTFLRSRKIVKSRDFLAVSVVGKEFLI